MRKTLVAALALCLLLVGCGKEEGEVNNTVSSEDIEVCYQYPKYPAGCEAASVCTVLTYYGYELNIDTLLQGYMPMSDTDWTESYYGSVYEGGFAFPPAVVKTIENYLVDQDSNLKVEDFSGCSWDELAAKVNIGYPMIVWYTIDDESPKWWDGMEQGDYKVWTNLHCIVIYDVDDEWVYVADPIDGQKRIQVEHFQDIWEECGGYAVLVSEDVQ